MKIFECFSFSTKEQNVQKNLAKVASHWERVKIDVFFNVKYRTCLENPVWNSPTYEFCKCFSRSN